MGATACDLVSLRGHTRSHPSVGMEELRQNPLILNDGCQGRKRKRQNPNVAFEGKGGFDRVRFFTRSRPILLLWKHSDKLTYSPNCTIPRRKRDNPHVAAFEGKRVGVVTELFCTRAAPGRTHHLMWKHSNQKPNDTRWRLPKQEKHIKPSARSLRKRHNPMSPSS